MSDINQRYVIQFFHAKELHSLIFINVSVKFMNIKEWMSAQIRDGYCVCGNNNVGKKPCSMQLSTFEMKSTLFSSSAQIRLIRNRLCRQYFSDNIIIIAAIKMWWDLHWWSFLWAQHASPMVIVGKNVLSVVMTLWENSICFWKLALSLILFCNWISFYISCLLV